MLAVPPLEILQFFFAHSCQTYWTDTDPELRAFASPRSWLRSYASRFRTHERLCDALFATEQHVRTLVRVRTHDTAHSWLRSPLALQDPRDTEEGAQRGMIVLHQRITEGKERECLSLRLR